MAPPFRDSVTVINGNSTTLFRTELPDPLIEKNFSNGAASDLFWIFIILCGILVCFLLSKSTIKFTRYTLWKRKDTNGTNCCINVCSTHTAQQSITEGNQCKLHQKWAQAGDCFQVAAKRFQDQGNRQHDAASNFAEAANCYRKLKHPEFTLKAVQCLEKAARIYAEIGQFSIAARHLEEAGDLIAQASGVDNNSREAIRLYQKAADYWDSEDSPASAADSRSKAAHVMGDMGSVEMLSNAAKEFENLGVSSQSHSLLGFGAKDHMLKACLSQLCVNPSSCPELADDLARKCDSFAGSDEQTLVKKLSAACDAGDTASFDNAVTEFERFNNLDDWSRRRLAFTRRSIMVENLR